MKQHLEPLNADNQDKMTEARSSFGQSTSTWKDFFYALFCPCLGRKNMSQNSSDHRFKLPIQRQSRQFTEMGVNNKQLEMNWKRGYTNEDEIIVEYRPSFKKNNSQPYRKSAIERTNSVLNEFVDFKKAHNFKSGFSIYKYQENKLISVGQFSDRMLCVINSVKLEPSQTAYKKTEQAKNIQVKRQLYSNYLDQFWDQRYFFFQKFDEGIKIHEDQWCLIPPEVVCQHLSSNVRCQVLLQAFSGVGNTTVKFGSTCNRVIANTCLSSIDGLVTNIKIYGVQNIEILCEDFLNIKNVFPEVVFLAPKCNEKTPSQNEKLLRLYLQKALTLSHNIMLLLPPFMQIDKVISIFSSCAYKKQTKYSTCSTKIQKIFYLGKLKFIAIYFGALVQRDIKISDELEFIYDFLRKDLVGATNFYKKLVKEIREQYGMMNLLYYIYDSENLYLGKENLQNFEEYVLKHNLITKQRIEQMKQESRKGSFTSVVEQEKLEQQEENNNKSDRTISDYSAYSLIGIKKKLLLQRQSCEITGQRKLTESIEECDQDGTHLQRLRKQLVGNSPDRSRKSAN